MLMLRNYLRRTVSSSVHLRNRYGIKLNDCGLAGYSSHQSLMEGLQSKRDKDRKAITNAFISRMLINYVASCPAFSLPRETSIRESILDETLIKQYIKSQIRQANPYFNLVSVQNWIQSQDFHLRYKQVTSAFDIKRGCKINFRVYIQNSMHQAQTAGSKIILNPLSFTDNYFQCFLHGSSHFRYFLSGSKDIGKSFSFVTYAYLSEYIHLLPFQLQEIQRIFSKNLLYSKGQISQTLNISRMVYLSLGNKFDLGKMFRQLVPQFRGIYQQADILEDITFPVDSHNRIIITKEQMKRFLNLLNKKIGHQKIYFSLVIDEANKIFRLVRKIYQKLTEQRLNKSNPLFTSTYKKMPEYALLKQYSDILQLFAGCFTKICFHSSQSQQVQLMDEFDSKDQQMYLFKIFTQSYRTWIFRNFQQSELLQIQYGHIQLYKIFLFELQCLLSRQSAINLQKLRQIFLHTFHLREDTQTKHPILRWRNDVRFLHIRKYLKSCRSIYSKLLDMIYQKQKRNENQSQNYLIKLKKEIENYRFQQLRINNITQDYISKAENPSLSLGRHFMLIDISSEIALLKSRMDSSSEIQPDQFIYNSLQISKYQKERLCSTLNIGYASQDGILFPLSPRDTLTLLLQVAFTQQYYSALQTIVNDIWLKHNQNDIFGKMLDNLSFCIFKRAAFKLRIHQAFNKELKLFQCQKSAGFLGIHTITHSYNHFKNIFQECRKHPNEYIAGYPIKRNQNFDTASEAFDNIVVKMNNGNNFDMVVFDWTIGAVQSKILHFFDSSIHFNFFKTISFKQNIALTFYLVAPQYQVNYFLKNSKKMHLFTEQRKQIKINGYTHTYCYRLASYDSNLPFSAGTLHPIRFSHDIMRQVYSRNEDTHLFKNRNK